MTDSCSVVVRGAVMFGVLGALAIPSHAEGRPGWCAGLSGNHSDVTGIQVIREGKQPGIVLKQIVDTMCKGPDRGQMGEVEAVRQQWMKRFNMTEADWPDVVEFSMLSQGDRQNGDEKGGEYFAGNGDPAQLDALGTKLTERARLDYMMWCLRNKEPAEWAICQGDIDAFDQARFGAELRADRTMSGADKMRLRMKLDRLPHTFEIHADKVAHEARFNPHIDELMALAAETRKAWPERGRVLAAVRNQAPGCGDATFQAWKDAVASSPASGESIPSELSAIVATPSGYLASLAFVSCKENRDSLPELVGGVDDALTVAGLPIGPRTAADIALRKRGFPSNRAPEAKSKWPRSVSGTIQKLATTADGIGITFKKVIVTSEPCVSWKDTNHVIHYADNFDPQYERLCTKHQTVKTDETPAPVTVIARLAAGLKVGMTVTVVGSIPFSAVAPGGATTLFGVPVSMAPVADHSETVAPSATAGGSRARRGTSRRVAGGSQLR